MTEIERKALLGDKMAQERCTENGVILKCPCCGGNNIKYESYLLKGVYDSDFFCEDCFCSVSICSDIDDPIERRKEALGLWNTRIIPPVGKCEDCLYFKPKNSVGTQGICMCKELEMNYGGELYPLHDYYSKYFKQKECE